MPLVLPLTKYPPGRIPRGLTHWWTLGLDSYEPKASGICRPLVGTQYGTAGSSASVRFGGPPFNAGDGLFRTAGDANGGMTLNADPLAGGGPTTPISIAFWLNVESFTTNDGGDPRYLCLQNDFVVSSAATLSNAIIFGCNGVEVYTDKTLSTGTWCHVVYTFDGTTQLAYFNGLACVMNSAAAGNSGTAGVWAITARGIGVRSWPGRMADVMLCVKTVLNAGEIAALYGSYFLQQRELPALYTSGAAPTFIAAWAANSNLPVLGTGTY